MPPANSQRVISGIIFVIGTGLRWRDAPLYSPLIRRNRLGVFNNIFAAVAAKGGKPDWVMI